MLLIFRILLSILEAKNSQRCTLKKNIKKFVCNSEISQFKVGAKGVSLEFSNGK